MTIPVPAWAAAAGLAAVLATTPAHALVVLDTFGPGDSSDGGNYSLQDGLSSGGITQSLAVPFTLAEAARVHSILTSVAGVGEYSIRIVGDAGGLPLGAVLFSATLNDPSENTLLSGLQVDLGAGDYWLAAYASPESYGTWQGGNVANAAPWAFSTAVDSGWRTSSAFDAPAARISVVPEPSSWALMLGGVALVGAARARRRNS